ncbi:MAG: NAD-dependent epimerase/dehydratase family protein [Imperialibacter sp.]|uniref:NAD-dependent epimerase/dehydratase family protein n=1 Tax=Imperialibacter sp. TaxID=2038411 RepID=UPI0032EDA19E
MQKTLLTGSSGFFGSRFKANFPVIAHLTTVSLQSTQVNAIDFNGMEVAVHAAGIAHRMEKTDDQLYFAVNRDLTLELAQAAKAAGVPHFVFISTIKVFGVDASDTPITVRTVCHPNNAYGQSKWEAEEGLRALEDDAFKVAIIRPPLVYGPGAKGNLEKIMRMIAGSLPLPFGGIHNRRSMVYLDNLIAYIHFLIEKRASGIFLPADEPAISTTYMVEQLAQTISPGKRLLSLPGPSRSLLRQLKPEFHQRLFGSLEVESTYDSSGFQPPHTIEEGLQAMAAAYQKKH